MKIAICDDKIEDRGVLRALLESYGQYSEVREYWELNLLGRQLENMPECKAIFERYTESYPKNWARKIIWAYQKLKKEGGVLLD